MHILSFLEGVFSATCNYLLCGMSWELLYADNFYLIANNLEKVKG